MRIPALFRAIPAELSKANPPATAQELSHARTARAPFIIDQWANPYMDDVVRAFRLVENASTYLEIGTRDKRNVAWAAERLAVGATIIDVDIDVFRAQEALLRDKLDQRHHYHCIVGDSVADSTLAKVKMALNGQAADALFCDSSHMHDQALAEFDLYFPLLRIGGILMYHDCYWEGNATDKGKAQALQAIDRLHPVYVAFMNEPIHRFLPRSSKGDVWGGVSIIIKT